MQLNVGATTNKCVRNIHGKRWPWTGPTLRTDLTTRETPFLDREWRSDGCCGATTIHSASTHRLIRRDRDTTIERVSAAPMVAQLLLRFAWRVYGFCFQN